MSHCDSLKILNLIEQQYLYRHAANQTEWPSENWTLQYQLNHAFYFISLLYLVISSLPKVRSDAGGEVHILGGDVSVIVKKYVYVNMCLILNGYRDSGI